MNYLNHKQNACANWLKFSLPGVSIRFLSAALQKSAHPLQQQNQPVTLHPAA